MFLNVFSIFIPYGFLYYYIYRRLIMNATDELSGKIHGSDFDRSFTNIYGFDRMENQKKRYCNLLKDFELVFGGSGYLRLFSAPGRIEIGGNHTDHNNGRVIAAAIGLDSIAAARSNRENIIRVHSKDFSSDTVTLDDLGVHSTETGSSSALIRGIAARFQQMGYAIGGFDAYTATDVPTGSGLSSSAAFEVLIGTILNHVYNAGRIPDYEIAAICQYAENVYFGKPSGLMDQLASAVGGIVFIDFKDKRHPAVETIDIDFDNAGYSVCIVDTGGSHCELTDEYASIPREMILVAEELGVHSLREATADKLMLNIEAIRRRLGDRALLRAFHFFGEDERVALQAKALQYD